MRTERLYPVLLAGQNDTRVEEGTELPRFVKVGNIRLKAGDMARRPGMRRRAVSGTDATSLDLTAASSHYAVIPDAAQQALKWPFTLEFLIEPDAYAGAKTIVGFAHATAWPFRVWMNGATISITLTDTLDATQTIAVLMCSGTPGEQFAVQLKVDADGTYTDTVHALLDGSSYNSYVTSSAITIGSTLKTPGGDLYLGRDNAGNYFDGHLDYFRGYRYEAPNFDHAWTRWPTPREPYMAFDYTGEIDANNWVLDRSPYENHGDAMNTPGTAATLCVNPAPVQALHGYRDKDNKTRLLVVAGGRVHLAEL